MRKHLVITENNTVCNVAAHEIDGEPDFSLPDSYYNYWPIEREEGKEYRAFIIEIPKHLTTIEVLESIVFDGAAFSLPGVSVSRQDEITIDEPGST